MEVDLVNSVSKDFFSISLPSSSSTKKLDFKVSNLYFKLHFYQDKKVKILFNFQEIGIVNVEMVNCGIIGKSVSIEFKLFVSAYCS